MEINNLIELTKDCLNVSGLKPTTADRYIGNIERFLTYYKKLYVENEELDIDNVRKFLNYLQNEKKLSIGTVNDYRSSIKYLFEAVMDKGWNDRKIGYLKGYKALPVVLSKCEILKLISSMDNILYKTIFLTIYSSGLRIQEAINLRISDIDSNRMQINIRESKNGSSRYAILSEKNLEFLREYFKVYWRKKFGKFHPEDYIFCMISKTSPVSETTLRTALSTAVQKARITKNVTVHTLRHSFATHLLESNESIFTIKELLGHRSIRSTAVYLHVADMRRLGARSPLDMEV